MGFLYTQHFNPFSPYERLLPNEDNSYFLVMCQVTVLQPNSTYILIVTPSFYDEIGNFTVWVSGPSKAVFYPISIENIYHQFFS